MPYRNILENAYQHATLLFQQGRFVAELDEEQQYLIDVIVEKSESFIGVVNVLITSLTYKIAHTEQDIRYHQAKLPSGYSGRTIDTKYIAPFLKSKGLKSAKEAGWLTRSLEQPFPYTLDYQGRIRDKAVKSAFLDILHAIEEENKDSNSFLIAILLGLITQRENNKIEIQGLDKKDFAIESIINLLNGHFQQSIETGRSRLPVLAIHSIYELLTPQLSRYRGKSLQPLTSHTSADARHGDIGDIQINNGDGTPFEAIEVKYGIKIHSTLIIDAYQKLQHTSVERYYILSTADIDYDDYEAIQNQIQHISEEHGCQVIVNGIIKTIQYYLRLIEHSEDFLQIYTDKLLADKVIKQSHKQLWKDLIDTLP